MQSGVGSMCPRVIQNLFLLSGQSSIQWESFRSGIEICRLHQEAGGSSSALLRYTAGASLGRHIHVGYEHILILAGSQVDDSGEHHIGTLLIHPPGSSHAIVSPNGCIVLAIWEKGVRFSCDEGKE
jgi:anti-sigma factor ChrR (cupin superfamily)